MKRILLVLIIALCQSVVWAQISVKGKITDVNGKGVEYVSVGVDSLFTISDADGYFELKIRWTYCSYDISSYQLSYTTIAI